MTDRQTEERWRAALETRGMQKVQAELELRPGAATDLMYGYVDGPPYPTRGFCEAWCRGAPPRGFGVSLNTGMVIGMTIMVVLCSAGAVGGLFAPGDQRAGRFVQPTPRTAAPGSGQQTETSVRNTMVIAPAASHSSLTSCSSVTSAEDQHTVAAGKPCRPNGPHTDVTHQTR